MNTPKQNKKAGMIFLIGLLFSFCLLLGVLLALITETTGGTGLLQLMGF